MTLNIHQNAVIKINEDATKIIPLIEKLPSDKPINDYPSEVHVAHKISEENVVEEIDVAVTDYNGRIISREFFFEGQKYGLSEDNYRSLVDLAYQIQSKKGVRELLSLKFIERVIFNWLKDCFIRNKIESGFFTYLESESIRSIKERATWVPISNLEISESFNIGICEFRPFTSEVANNWRSLSLIGKKEHTSDESSDFYFKELEKSYKGYAMAVIKTNAESNLATEISIRESQLSTAILSIYSGATRYPFAKSSCKVRGTEHIREFNAFFVENSTIEPHGEVIDLNSTLSFQLTSQDIDSIKAESLEKISNLMNQDKLSSFEETVLQFIKLYSKSSYTSEPLEKLVFILSALESTMLKSKSENIQQNLSDRLAFFMGNSLVERKRILKLVKTIYAFRSNYLHHGLNDYDLDQITDFLKFIWMFFTKLVNSVSRFETKEEFLNNLDDLKYSGHPPEK